MSGIEPRQRQLLRLLWQEGRLSRWELHERMGVNPNAVGVEVAGLLGQGLLRELPSEPAGPGRPRVPLEIDPGTRHVVGLAIGPGRAEVDRLNLRGEPIGPRQERRVERPDEHPEELIAAAAALVAEARGERSLVLGVSVTGVVDPESRSILFSSAVGGRGQVSLEPIYQAAGGMVTLLENDMHALAARWLLTHQAEAGEDVLLVSVADGAIGAAVLIGGRPNRGCVIAGNELGHVRFFVETDECYCGHVGCLERICSTPFLRRLGRDSAAAGEEAGDGGTSLGTRAAAFDGTDAAVAKVIDFVSAGLANAVNFLRPNRLVLISEWTRHAGFTDALLREVRGRLLRGIAGRVGIECWDQPAAHPAEAAGWLALASLYREGWER